MNRLLFILVLSGFSEVAVALGRTEDRFCLQSQHSCNDISCIPQSHVCNGDEECVDGSDEVGCADAPTCSGELIPCPKTTGVTSCVETQEQCLQPTGCGALPDIVNGEASFLGSWNKKSAIGAWADVTCNSGYKSCTNKIRCLESGVWTTTVCEPEQPEETDRCFQELGECDSSVYSKSNLVALRSTDCDSYCQCVHNGTNADGSVSYKWLKRPCPPGTKFDQNINTCNHASSVTCRKFIQLYLYHAN
ncbi:very low-density lipoprotein receptor-like isoform X2 [Ruditapes philippinarum]|uniref:very low-density lipoprotein receptor-like isoform X2 n=1 Tax=Ruditapes philippinarum TaxID=129788 RepID=UPI00295B2453|nr:very low-density lipoprotein receptor-like isoform X2 [Ruditapes philippinarum]